MRSLLCGFVLLTASLMRISSPAQTPAMGQSSTEAQLAAIHTQFQQGDWKAASAGAKTLLAAHPENVDAMYLLARSLQHEGQARESLSWFTRAAALTRPTAEDLRVVALDYVLLADYPDALRWLAESLRINPKNSEAWYDLARARMMGGDYGGAEAPMKQALALAPGMVKAENNLGLILEAQNRNEEAAAAYKRAVAAQAADPHPSEQPLLNYGALLVEQQHAAEAVPYLEQASALAPANAHIHEQLARALEQSGQGAQAVAEMQQAVHLDAANPRLHYQLGMMYRHAGDADKAKQELALSSQLYGKHSSEPAQH